MARKTRKALDRLRMIFEEPERVELKRATIAGYEPAKASRFGAATGMDPARAENQAGRKQRARPAAQRSGS